MPEMENIEFITPTPDEVLASKAHVAQEIKQAKLDAEAGGGYGSVEAQPNSIMVRDTEGRSKIAEPLLDSEITNLGIVKRLIARTAEQISDSTYTKEETETLIKEMVKEILESIDGVSIEALNHIRKTIYDHIDVFEAHGGTYDIIPGRIMSRDSYGCVKVAPPREDTDVARLDTIKQMLQDLDVDSLVGVAETVKELITEVSDLNDLVQYNSVIWETD